MIDRDIESLGRNITGPVAYGTSFAHCLEPSVIAANSTTFIVYKLEQ